jgi:hypothetical protein
VFAERSNDGGGSREIDVQEEHKIRARVDDRARDLRNKDWHADLEWLSVCRCSGVSEGLQVSRMAPPPDRLYLEYAPLTKIIEGGHQQTLESSDPSARAGAHDEDLWLGVIHR